MLVRELRKLLSLQDQDAEVLLTIDTSDHTDIPFSELESFVDDVKCLETDNDGHVVIPGWVGSDGADEDGESDDDEQEEEGAGDDAD